MPVLDDPFPMDVHPDLMLLDHPQPACSSTKSCVHSTGVHLAVLRLGEMRLYRSKCLHLLQWFSPTLGHNLAASKLRNFHKYFIWDTFLQLVHNSLQDGARKDRVLLCCALEYLLMFHDRRSRKEL